MRTAPPPTTYAVGTWLFLRLLGCCYLFAFASLAPQVPGLIGSGGILPAAEYLEEMAALMAVAGSGLEKYRVMPTLAWVSSSDAFLVGLAYGGAIAAVLLVAGVASRLVLPLLWAAYLSLAVVSREFLSYQWDALLLEAGLLAIVVAPRTWLERLRFAPNPPPLARWLLWWLLFRLMLGSGIVKIASGDPAWRDLTALAFHYETQPLPTPIAWYAAQLPSVFHSASTAGVLALELVAPWLVFVGVTGRRIAAFLFAALQALIALTGNYAFFNLLTVALCVTLLDDRLVRRWRLGPPVTAVARLHPWPAVAAALLLVPLSAAVLVAQIGIGLPAPVLRVLDVVAPFRSVNPYGLFAVMTQTRPEIVVEGSMDGQTWRPYEFRHKPGPADRAPTWIAPLQPRLDWQMWFAALGRYEEEIWLVRFCERLLDGSPPVLRLLGANPFPEGPPRYVRASLYQYRFTRRGSGRPLAWWNREYLREYMPPISNTAGSLNGAPSTGR